MDPKTYNQAEIDRIVKEACARHLAGTSKLTPYRDLIAALRKQGISYRKIQQILAGEGLTVSYNAICQFVKVRRIGRPPRRAMYELEPLTPPPAAALDEVEAFKRRRRIEREQEPQNKPEPNRFEFDETKPLTLIPRDPETACAQCGHRRAEHDSAGQKTCLRCYPCRGWAEPEK